MCKTHEDRLLRPETAGTNCPLTQSHISVKNLGLEVLKFCTTFFCPKICFTSIRKLLVPNTNLCVHGYARWLAFKVLRQQTSGILAKSSSEFLNEMSKYLSSCQIQVVRVCGELTFRTTFMITAASSQDAWIWWEGGIFKDMRLE
jgi:hypothetical protein